MAAPAELTCASLSGKFYINTSLSDGVEAMHTLQGASWTVHEAFLAFAYPVVLTIKSYRRNRLPHIDITTAVGGNPRTEDIRVLDWHDAEHLDALISGKCQQKSRLFKTGQLQLQGPGSADDAAFLQAEKLPNGTTGSGFLDDEQLQTWSKNIDGRGFQSEEVWGFEMAQGERRLTRRVVTWTVYRVQWSRFVFDYRGEVVECNGLSDY